MFRCRGQHVVRVCVVGVECFVFVVSDEFLFGADRSVFVVEHVGFVAVVGAERPSAANAGEDGKVNAVGSLSLPRLAAGSVCIAANVGCRPSFVVVAFAAFPLFWPQIRAIAKQLRDGVFASGTHGRAYAMLYALRAPLAVLVPALVVVVPLFAYNMARFSSPFDFGSSYQLTVTDMTSYHQSWSNFIWTVAYYLFLPLRWTNMFPFLAVDAAPLKDWGFTEAMPGGLFVMAPLALASLACPFLRRHMRACGHAGMWRTLRRSCCWVC